MFANMPQTTKKMNSVYQYRNNNFKLEDLSYYKNYFDKPINEAKFNGLENIVIEIPYRIQFASYMMAAPPFDIKGRKINAIDKKTKRMKFIFFTIFPDENKSYILLSSLKEDLDVYGQYFEQIRNSPVGLIQYYINVFIPIYSQNLIISPRLWDSWDEHGKDILQIAVADPHSLKLLTLIRFYLKNIEKNRLNKEIKINTIKLQFDFFI